MKVNEMFPEEDRYRVAEAIRDAELRTSGEIVAMVATRSSDYPRGELLGALLLTLLGTLGAGLVVHLHSALLVVLVELPLFFLSVLFVRMIPPLKRLFIRKDLLRERVRQRAIRAFYDHGLHRTREASGVLIMISLFERHVEVLADRGISARVNPQTWTSVVETIVLGIRNGRTGDALLDAVRRVGEILAAEFPAVPNDVNELRDHLIVEDD